MDVAQVSVMTPAQSDRATSFGGAVQGEHSSAIKKYTKALSYLAEMTSPMLAWQRSSPAAMLRFRNSLRRWLCHVC